MLVERPEGGVAAALVPSAEASLRTLLRLAPDEWLIAEPASPLVNNVKSHGPELLAGLLD
jgi:hypothetical protein